jgi:4'-phosphopantetheinyl transferase
MADFDQIVPLSPEIPHIWVVELSVAEGSLVAYYGLLSKDERNRAARFKFNKDRNKYIICRGALRELSAKYLKMNPKEIVFEYSEFGKPKFTHKTSVRFNVSHSGDFALIGFIENHSIGVDIELIKYDFDVLEIAHNFFSRKEMEALQGMPINLQHIGFFRCWTRKEAFIKAEGSGLSFPLNSFAVSIHADESAVLLETDWDKEEKEKWELYPFVPVHNYRAAMAVKGKINSVVVNEWQHTM